MTISEAASKLRAREISAVDLARESLRAIHREQPRLNAFITITGELALEQARRADEELARGIDRGPLHGIPYALKDVFATRGIRTTCGSKLFADFVPDYDCAVYERLTEAGAVLMGKTGLHELAYGITSNNPHFGPVRNPRDPERIPGGSSGGSGAAVAADLVFFALGTDTGGSIRIPAAYCGCFGLKPTSGRVSRYGVLPLDFSLDHTGPLTRTAKDAGLVMNAIAGFDARDDTSSKYPVEDYAAPGEKQSLAGTRIGVPENFFNERVVPEVRVACGSALARAESLGAALVPIRVPDPAEINVIGRVILLSEVSALMEQYSHRRAEIGEDVLALIDQGRLLAATDYINAQRLRRVYQREWSRLWGVVDLVFTPTAPIAPPLIGQPVVPIEGVDEDVRLATTRFVRAINVLGLPAASVPVESGEFLAGLQIIGPPFSTRNILSAAALLER
ncbi:MAG TPA: amidase [Bryobacteraceae bacterium]|nr:amidase [Bryobacteraceae bacterium]